jgi:cytosine/adenosine deaminase-related metal-dependent hydrolase
MKDNASRPASDGIHPDSLEQPVARTAPERTANVSRRGFLGSSGAGIAAVTAAGAGFLPSAADAGGRSHGRDRDWEDDRHHRDCPRSGHPGDRILLKGGVVLSLDAAVGDFAGADVLIEGKKILAVGPNLGANAQVVDCSGTIVMPGFVDCHLHAWEGQFRGVIPNAKTISDYNWATHAGPAPFYRPRDIYIGNLITALNCINAGITCFLDNSHNSRSSEHSDAAIEALFHSGARAVHASGAPQRGTWDMQWPQDLIRLKAKYFSSDDQLVTLRMFTGLAAPNSIENVRLAKQLGLWITTEGGGGAALPQLAALGLLDARHTFNHVGGVSEENWRLIREAGAQVNVCPRSDPQYALGPGINALQSALDHGMRPGFSNDNEMSYPVDMFMEMRVAFFTQRALAKNAVFREEPNPPAPIDIRDILEFATVQGAANCGLSHKVGTLTPGKEADVIVIRRDDVNTWPGANAVGTVVQYAMTPNVETVIIGGRIRKWNGRLLGVNMDRIRRLVLQSRAYLYEAQGLSPPDVLAPGTCTRSPTNESCPAP